MNSTGQQKGRSESATRPGPAKGAAQAKMPPRKAWLWFVVILLANFLLGRLLAPGAEAPITVPYTLFKEEVRKGNVQAIHSRGETMTGRFKAPITYPPAGEKSAAPKGEPKTTSEGGAAPRENPYLSGWGGYGGEKPFSEETAKTIDAKVLKIIDESHEEAKRLLSEHRKQLDALAEALVERETLDEQEILNATGLPRAPALETGKLPVPGAGSKSTESSS